MKRMNYFAIVIATLLTLTPVSHAQPIRLSTVEPVIVAIANVQNYAAVIVEGALPETQLIEIVEGPGQLMFEKSSKRWLWNWQPAAADVGRSYGVHLRGRSEENYKFEVQVKALVEDRTLYDIKRGNLYSGIPTTIRMKQPGLDGAYRMTLRLDDEIVADSTEPTLAVRPALHDAVGKQARIEVEYTAPLTGKPTLLASYSTKVKYPPFRVPPTLEIPAGEPIFFHAAMGVPPNFYTTVPGRFLMAKSDGFFEDTARMISGIISEGNDPFGLFSATVKVDSGSSKRLCFDFGLRPTDKCKTITEKSGRLVTLTLYDPITKQSNEVEVRIFPRLSTMED